MFQNTAYDTETVDPDAPISYELTPMGWMPDVPIPYVLTIPVDEDTAA